MALRRKDDYDEFYETIAVSRPRTYRSEANLEIVPSIGEQWVGLVAGILYTLLVLRLLVALVSSDMHNTFVRAVFALTGWLVTPAALVVGGMPRDGAGFLDLAAILTIIAVAVIAWILRRGIRHSRDS